MFSTRSRSPPALKAPSAPRTITARVSSSAPIAGQMFASSRCIVALTAFSLPSARSVSRSTCGAGRSSSSDGNASYTPGSLEGELDGHEPELDAASLAQDVERDRLADPVAHHQALDVVDLLDELPVDRDDQILRPQPRRRRRR